MNTECVRTDSVSVTGWVRNDIMPPVFIWSNGGVELTIFLVFDAD